MLDLNNITSLRMKRMCFSEKAGDIDDSYDMLFKDISPVPTIYWSSPGEAPVLPFHVDFNDRNYNDRRRAARKIVKGRFQKGAVGYIEANDMELFAALYKKPIDRFTLLQNEITDILHREGPMNVQLIKQLTNRLVKELSPALQSLQTAYIVFEDQVDDGWDRAWYLLEGEFPDFNIERYTAEEALDTVMMRFANRIVAFDENMAKSYYKLPPKDIGASLKRLSISEKLVKTEYGYMKKEDRDFLCENNLEPDNSLYILHRNDFYARSFEHELNKKYKLSGFKTMQYVLINGMFKGAVYGNFRFSPNEIEDIILDVSEEDAENLKESIIDMVYKVNSYESPIKKYNGRRYGESI